MTQVIADLQLHSRYSRAVSQQMVISEMAKWAKYKGIDLLATGDWTHPLWLRELKAGLEEDGSGLLKVKSKKEEVRSDEDSLRFLLSGEVSCIYSQGGKLRRIHTLIFAPSFAVVDKINAELTRRGCNLLSDGRPIIGLTSIQLAEVVFSVSEECLLIPAHCLLPDSCLIGEGNKPKPIKDFKKDDLVLSHNGIFRKIEKVLKRNYHGETITIKPWYFREGLTTTPEHPYLAIKTLKKCPSTGDICRPSRSHLALCKRKTCLFYKKEWIMASNLETGDVIAYPRQNLVKRAKTVRIIFSKGSSHKEIANKIKITPEFGRLIGYYLAEGYTNKRDCISFCFSRKEKEFIDDVKKLMFDVFNIKTCRQYERKNAGSVELTFYSKILSMFFAKNCYSDEKIMRAGTKQIPSFLLEADQKIQAEIIRGWYRGDKGYTSSRVLMNQFKMLCLRLGIIPSVLVDKKEFHLKRGHHGYGGRIINAVYDNFYFSNFSFFEDTFGLKKEITKSQTKSDRRHGWIDDGYVYLPVKEIYKKQYHGPVYNLEVEKDHSYTAEFACVHNCWTPWFSLFGSMSGFDSISEAFGPYADKIYAVETGLSSDPAMNWRIKELDNRSIVSFSDAHSGPKLGREATVFEAEEISYKAVKEAITEPKDGRRLKIEKQTNQIAYTIEFYPEEGKYHYTGHRACNVRQSPEETKKLGTTCTVCGKALTVGVMHRVEELAGRSDADLKLTKKEIPHTLTKGVFSEAFPYRPPYVMLVPLQEILAESFLQQVQTEKVQNEYLKLVGAFGGEFSVLLNTDINEIVAVAGERIAQGVEKVRKGEIMIDPGYDGVFGVVKIWRGDKDQLTTEEKKQLTLF